eukprot:TRINITY_DN5506_c1_g1_i1.p1 TRINITY_DN5506_c1_g1~~TRINITY_DN5506_c1_g1_i1.p1  ORF type:complete len:342 (+),score=89.03 TRINITY_DN5506_c1_g1_i1:66-1028(+)
MRRALAVLLFTTPAAGVAPPPSDAPTAANSSAPDSNSTAAPTSSTPSQQGTEFSYLTPHEWYAQSSDWAECGNQLQSPIELSAETADAAPAAYLKLWLPRIPPSVLTVRNTGHSVSVDMSSRGITLSSATFWSQFTLQEMHYHTPSEHVIDGRRRPLERHLVFAPSDESLLLAAGRARTPKVVIGVLYDVAEGEGDPMLQAMLDGGVTATLAKGSGVELPAMMPSAFDFVKDRFFSYAGSLTTPPCQEVVHWMVSADVKPATQQQLDLMVAMTEAMGAAGSPGSPPPHPSSLSPTKGTARPLQQRNGRTVKIRHYYSSTQ